MPVMDSIKAIGHGIGWLIPGVQEAQAMEASANAHRQKTLNDAINRAIQYETANPRSVDEDPDYKDRLSRLFDMQGKVQQMGPFDNPKSIGGQFWHDYISLHPDALMPSQTQKPRVTATPGPPMQGQPAGQPNLSVYIPSVGQATGDVVGTGMPAAPPSTALPGTSPASPEAQAKAAATTGGGTAQNAPSAFPQIPEPPAIAGIGDQGTGTDSQPVFKTDATALGSAPSLTLPPRPAPIRMPVSLSGDVSQPLAEAAIRSQEPYIHGQAAVEQALNTLRGQTEFQMAEAPRKLEMIKQAMGPQAWDALDKLPGFKTELISAVYGVQIPGIGQMFTPHTMSPGATGAEWKRKYPGPTTDWMDDGTVYEEKYSAMQGQFFEPKFIAPFQVQTPGGTMGTVPKTAPGAAATPTPGSIAPALVQPSSTATQTPTPGGGTLTERKEKKTPGGVTQAPAPTAGSSTTPPVASTAPTAARVATKPHPTPGGEGVAPFPRVDTYGRRTITPALEKSINETAIALTQPNMSNAQQSEQIKLLMAGDKWKEAQVRQRIADDGLPTISWDLAVATRAQFSNQALTHMDNISSLVAKLDKDGKLGPIMSRWNDFMLGKVGAGDPDYAKLRNQIDLMTKALGVVHGGARGGGSIQMYQSFLDKINASRMDAGSLNAALSVEKEWLTTYANPARTAGVPGPSGPSNAVTPVGVPKVGESFGGSKVKAVRMVK